MPYRRKYGLASCYLMIRLFCRFRIYASCTFIVTPFFPVILIPPFSFLWFFFVNPYVDVMMAVFRAVPREPDAACFMEHELHLL
jgi:hypothetical protein